jgi:NhaA family Na+:H+ antiporter
VFDPPEIEHNDAKDTKPHSSAVAPPWSELVPGRPWYDSGMSSAPSAATRLDRPVRESIDHVLGAPDAGITLVEYGSYACPHCRAANERIAALRDRFGDRMRYVFRHRPVTGSELARRAAELVERAPTPEAFWRAHMALMTRSETLTEDDLAAVARELGVPESGADDPAEAARAAAAVDADVASARRSGVLVTPTFFINGRRYEGVWDDAAFADAILGTLGHRVLSAALDFARWSPSAGVLLLLATVVALAASHSPLGPAFLAFWETPLGVVFGGRGVSLTVVEWINNGLLTIFFLVVGLEIKRELTVGHLASRRAAALPIAAALGGMVGPVAIYLLLIPDGPWARGWGTPMATDTAFAIALMVMLGRRVPVELRVFLTAATIIDDIGAIAVVAIFYSHGLDAGWLAAAAGITLGLALLSRGHIYRVAPYALLGLLLWVAVYAGGLHATLAGVILALFIPTRPPANLRALTAQAEAIVVAEARRSGEALRAGPSGEALRALDAIHDRLESPADRVLRLVSVRSSYVVLPLFALANAGVVISSSVLAGHEPLMLAIGCGLVIGKPLGMFAASRLAVAAGVAEAPRGYTWRQVLGAGALSGIGFTMSLFIAGEAFDDAASFAAAKIAVFAASLVAAVAGVAILSAGGAGRGAGDQA